MFQNFDDFLSKNIQICEKTLDIFDNFYAALMNLQVLEWESPQEKVFKNHEKAKNTGC